MVFWLSSLHDLKLEQGSASDSVHASLGGKEQLDSESKWRPWLLVPSVGGRQNWHALADFVTHTNCQVELLSKGASVISMWSATQPTSNIFLFFFLYCEGVAGHPGPYAVQEDQGGSDNYQILPALQSEVVHPRGGQTLPRHQDHAGPRQAREVAGPAQSALPFRGSPTGYF